VTSLCSERIISQFGIFVNLFHEIVGPQANLFISCHFHAKRAILFLCYINMLKMTKWWPGESCPDSGEFFPDLTILWGRFSKNAKTLTGSAGRFTLKICPERGH
jgi:hypothetical protein